MNASMLLLWKSLFHVLKASFLFIVIFQASANNVGYTSQKDPYDRLWLSQISVQIDAVDFELTYEFERKVIEQLSIAYLAVSEHFYVNMDSFNYLAFDVRIIEDYDRFLAIQKSEIGRVISQTGFYSLETEQLTILKKLSDFETFKTLKHEACHRVLHQNTTNRVRWLNEGVAENCEFAQYDYHQEKVVIHPNTSNHKYVKSFAKKSKLIPLKELLTNQHEHYHGDNVVLNQIQSGELIYYVMQLPEANYWMNELLEQSGHTLGVHEMQILERLIDLQEGFESWLLY